MGKNEIIGLVIIAIILMLTPLIQYKMMGKKEVSPKQAQPVVEEMDTAQAVIEEHPPVPAESLFAILRDTTASVKNIKVETENYIAYFSTRGADITRFILKKYATGDRLVNLIHEDTIPTFPYNFRVASVPISTRDIVFSCDIDSVSLAAGHSGSIRFSANLPSGVRILRDFAFVSGSYDIIEKICVESDSLPISSGELLFERVLYPTESGKRKALGYEARYQLVGKASRVKPASPGKDRKVDIPAPVDWLASSMKYFTVLVAPIKKDNVASGNILATTDSVYFEGENIPLPKFVLAISVPSTLNGFTAEHRLYLGPKDYFGLKEYKKGYENLVSFGWGWLRPIALGFLWLFVKLFSVFHNYGLVLIVFSIILKIVLLPTTHSSMRSARVMRELQPKLKELQKKYKNDQTRLTQETLKLYKEHKASPTGGCLPILFQMPIFIALFGVLSNTVELRGQPFILWIRDLSQKDPYYILPLVMSLTMFLSQKMTITDPKQKIMAYVMPVVFFFIFGGMPSGLVLYWTTFNILSLGHQYLFERSCEKANASEK